MASALMVIAPASSWAGATQKPGKYIALVVGLDIFNDWNLPSLNYAADDARLVCEWLVSPDGGGYEPENVQLITGAHGTRRTLINAMERIIRLAEPEDQVFLYLSTHGFFTASLATGTAAIACYDTMSTDYKTDLGPLIKESTALTRRSLHRFLTRLKARQRAIVLDLCHGGGAIAWLDRTYGPRGEGFAYSGRVTMLISSSAPHQLSWESKNLKGSIFTHFFLQGLRLYSGDLAHAFYFAQRRTSARSKKEKGFMQRPFFAAWPRDANMHIGVWVSDDEVTQ